MKRKTRGKKSKAKPKKLITVSLTMEKRLKDILEEVARDAQTDVPTVSQVLLVTAMRMGRNAGQAGMAEAMENAAATIMDLEAKLCRCRQVMEANDPGNARDIFGPPIPEPAPTPAAPAPEEGAPTVP